MVREIFFGFLFLYLGLNGGTLALFSSIWKLIYRILIKEIDSNKFGAKTVEFHCGDLLID